MKEKLASEAALLTDISLYLLGLGGKRIRPVISLSSARLFGMKEPSRELVMVSAGIELIHMATLLHDDIIDKSPTRRANVSAFWRYGLEPTLLTGDFLLVKAFGICAELDQFIVKNTERACIELTEGELLEGTLENGRRPTLEDYKNIVGKKTASLFALASTVGAHLAGAPKESVNLMNTFGRKAGVAFQMIDDILDVVADEDLLGKPVGTDLRQKTPTLINLLWLEESPQEAGDFFAKAALTLDDCKQAVQTIRESTVVDRAREIAKNCAKEAENALYEIQPEIDEKVRENLSSLLTYTLVRCL